MYILPFGLFSFSLMIPMPPYYHLDDTHKKQDKKGNQLLE